MNFSACEKRKLLSSYLSGSGIEIGPLHSAWPVRNVHVDYVDRYTRSQLIAQYPELNASDIAPTDKIDDGRYLKTFEKSSLDFIISSHVFEHCSDPIGTLKRWHEVTKLGGMILMAVPDKDYTFDKKRPLTEPKDLLEIHNGSKEVLKKLIKEHFELSENEPERDASEIAILAEKCIEEDFHIHFPVWNAFSFLDFICFFNYEYQIDYPSKLPFKVEAFFANGFEFLIALRVQNELRR